MCNWCEGSELLYNLEDESGGIGVGIDHNVLRVQFGFHSYGNVRTTMTAEARTFIKYCPMCGKYLKGVFNIGDEVLYSPAGLYARNERLLGANLIVTGYDEDKLVVAVIESNGLILENTTRYSVLPTDLVLKK
ncbi:hypothetical protein EfsSzw1_40 [Enterococcus phage EfsSzw-1]|uniref:Uncharacterized protein n=1 Tax=Enterococcus phage EfsSzw-1 TaxID=2419745 RepID=A0A411B7B4_9CAUD|nr:hypothetical protein EfsSzw1_40 [Enterococcus phage EfsSzw-1]